MWAKLLTLNPWVIFSVVAALAGSHTYVYTLGQSREKDAAAKVQLAAERVATKALLEANARAAQSDATFAKIQQDAEIKHHENQLAIDATRKQLATVKRLRDPGYRPADCGRLPKNPEAPSDIIDAAAAPGHLSTGFTEFLNGKFYSADQVAVYAKTCHDWVVSVDKASANPE